MQTTPDIYRGGKEAGLYEHAGWTGASCASDFAARWGVIRQADIYDGRGCATMGAAWRAAAAGGYRYFTSPKASRSGNHLYRIAANTARCVYAILDYQVRNARTSNHGYRTDITKRVRQIVRVARTRSQIRGTPFDLDPDDILDRVAVGRCEATGMKLDLENVHSPFAPSLDQRLCGQGYTRDNVQVVCTIYNLMKSDFSQGDVSAFLDHVARSRTAET